MKGFYVLAIVLGMISASIMALKGVLTGEYLQSIAWTGVFYITRQWGEFIDE
jgi:hypothetical protein